MPRGGGFCYPNGPRRAPRCALALDERRAEVEKAECYAGKDPADDTLREQRVVRDKVVEP